MKKTTFIILSGILVCCGYTHQTFAQETQILNANSNSTRQSSTISTDAIVLGEAFGATATSDLNANRSETSSLVDCSQEHTLADSTVGSGVGSSLNSDFKTASDITVIAGEDFTLNSVTANFLTFTGPVDPPVSATLNYYEDADGLPGALIGTETVVPTILSSMPWANPVADVYETSLEVTPFIFSGATDADTKYWIEISMGTAADQATVFWEATTDTPIEGEPAVQFNAETGVWAVPLNGTTGLPNDTQEVIYNFSGDCSPSLSVDRAVFTNFNFYPNPAQERLSLDAQQSIEQVTIFNMLGQIVLDQKVGVSNTQIDINNLSAGNYFMQVIIDGQKGVYKLLKK